MQGNQSTTNMGELEELKPHSALRRKIIGGIIGLVMVPCFALGGVTRQALNNLIPAFELTFIRIGSKISTFVILILRPPGGGSTRHILMLRTSLKDPFHCQRHLYYTEN